MGGLLFFCCCGCFFSLKYFLKKSKRYNLIWGGGGGGILYYNFQAVESRRIFLSWFTVFCQHRHCQISEWKHQESSPRGNPHHCLWFGTPVQQDRIAEWLCTSLRCIALKNFYLPIKKKEITYVVAASFDCCIKESQTAPISTPHDVLKPFTMYNKSGGLLLGVLHFTPMRPLWR